MEGEYMDEFTQVRYAPAAAARMPERVTSYQRRLCREFVSFWKAALLIFGVSVALSLCGVVLPRLTQAVLDDVMPTGDVGFLWQLIALLGALALTQVGLTVWRRLRVVQLIVAVDGRLMGGLCGHLLRLPCAFFRRNRSGDLLARLTDHINVRQLFIILLTRVAIDLVMGAVYVGMLFSYSVVLTGFVLGVFGLLAVFLAVTTPFVRRQHQARVESRTAHECQLLEILTGIDEVKAMGLEQPLLGGWQSLLGRYLERTYRGERIRQWIESAATGLQFVGTAGALVLGAFLVIQGTLTAGELVAYSLYVGLAMQPVLGLVALWDEVQQAQVAARRVEQVLTEPPETVTVIPKGSKLGSERLLPVHLERVSFAYGGPQGRPTLSDLTLTINHREILVLVGPSGSGKTTLLRLLAGLYETTSGTISFGDLPLGQWDRQALRQRMGVVFQETVLLSGTVAENIALGKPQPDAQAVEEAARLADAHEFIMALPAGYATMLGERGLTLSAGQRQRLAIARALYRRPDLLLLDEATSHLDPAAEARVLSSLRLLRGQCAIVCVAHRPALLTIADRVLELPSGAWRTRTESIGPERNGVSEAIGRQGH
jgi:ATP-binding cassette subfamily B protein